MRNRRRPAADARAMNAAAVSYDGDLDEFQALAEAAAERRRHAYFGESGRTPSPRPIDTDVPSAMTIVTTIDEGWR